MLIFLSQIFGQSVRNSFRRKKYFDKKQQKLSYRPIQSVAEGPDFNPPNSQPSSRLMPEGGEGRNPAAAGANPTITADNTSSVLEQSFASRYIRVLTTKPGFFHRFLSIPNKWNCRILDSRKKIMSSGGNFFENFGLEKSNFCLEIAKDCQVLSSVLRLA